MSGLLQQLAGLFLGSGGGRPMLAAEFDGDGDVVMTDAVSSTHAHILQDSTDWRQPSQRNPAAEVFGITEILEQILLNVPGKDVMVLQRVASNWKGTVEGSPDLQRMLFLAPTRERQIIVPIDSGLSPSDAWYYAESLRLGALSDLNVKPFFGKAKSPTDFQVVALNPYLSGAVLQKVDAYWEYLATFLERCWDDGRMAKLLETGRGMPSCGDMFLTQPPVKSVFCIFRIPPSVHAAICPCALCGYTLEEPLITPCCGRFYCKKHQHLVQDSCFACRSLVYPPRPSFDGDSTVWDELGIIKVDEGVRVRHILEALRSWNSRRGGFGEQPNGIWFEFPGDRIDEDERAPVTMLDQESYEVVKDEALKQEEEEKKGAARA